VRPRYDPGHRLWNWFHCWSFLGGDRNQSAVIFPAMFIFEFDFGCLWFPVGAVTSAASSGIVLGVTDRPTFIEPFDFPTIESDACDDIRNSGPDSADPLPAIQYLTVYSTFDGFQPAGIVTFQSGGRCFDGWRIWVVISAPDMDRSARNGIPNIRSWVEMTIVTTSVKFEKLPAEKCFKRSAGRRRNYLFIYSFLS